MVIDIQPVQYILMSNLYIPTGTSPKSSKTVLWDEEEFRILKTLKQHFDSLSVEKRLTEYLDVSHLEKKKTNSIEILRLCSSFEAYNVVLFF